MSHGIQKGKLILQSGGCETPGAWGQSDSSCFHIHPLHHIKVVSEVPFTSLSTPSQLFRDEEIQLQSSSALSLCTSPAQQLQKYLNIINPVLSTMPKSSPTPATGKKSNSTPAKTSTNHCCALLSSPFPGQEHQVTALMNLSSRVQSVSYSVIFFNKHLLRIIQIRSDQVF